MEFRSLILIALSTAVTIVARLLGCAAEDLMVALSTRKIKAGKDNITKKLTLQQVHPSLNLSFAAVFN